MTPPEKWICTRLVKLGLIRTAGRLLIWRARRNLRKRHA